DRRHPRALPAAAHGLPRGQLLVAAVVAVGPRRALGGLGRQRAVGPEGRALRAVPPPVLGVDRAGGEAGQARGGPAGRRQLARVDRLAPRRLALPARHRHVPRAAAEGGEPEEGPLGQLREALQPLARSDDPWVTICSSGTAASSTARAGPPSTATSAW